MDLFIALDVSLASSALCALNAHGKVVKEAKVDSEPDALIAALRALPGNVVAVGLEAGPLSQWLHLHMSDAGFTVVRFNLSPREVEEMLLERGIDLSYETIRRWTVKFGPQIERKLRRRQGRSGDVWHLDEVVVKIAGTSFWLWRAVDQHGVVPDEILQSRRDKRAAKRLLVRLIKRHGIVPKRLVTDKLRSHDVARREVAPGLDHWSHKGLNNRAENSHLPFRKRERTRQGHRSPGELQRFVAVQSATRNCVHFPPHRRSALTIRYHRLEAFDAWKSAASIA